MKVAILTWEYPPRVVGEIAAQVRTLALGLADSGLEVDVVTFHENLSGVDKSDGLKVHRVSNPVVHHLNILTWSLSLAAEFERVVSNLNYEEGGVDLLDAHEWPCIPAAASLKKALDLPFVYTIYSLEDHRSADPSSPLSVSIKSIEWLGAYESTAVAARSSRVAEDIERIRGVPNEKVRLIPPNTATWLKETTQLYAKAIGGQGDIP